MQHNVSLGDNDNPQVPDGCGLVVARLAVAGAALVYLALKLTQDRPRPMPTCVNHPGRPAYGGFDEEFYCHECVAAEIVRRKLWQGQDRRIVGIRVTR